MDGSAIAYPLHPLQFSSMVLQWSSFRLLEVFVRKTLYLSPFLFSLVMEVFTRMIDLTSSAGLISGFKVGRSSTTTMSVSHLFFADDTIFFCENGCEHMGSLRCVLTLSFGFQG